MCVALWWFRPVMFDSYKGFEVAIFTKCGSGIFIAVRSCDRVHPCLSTYGAHCCKWGKFVEISWQFIKNCTNYGNHSKQVQILLNNFSISSVITWIYDSLLFLEEPFNMKFNFCCHHSHSAITVLLTRVFKLNSFSERQPLPKKKASLHIFSGVG